MGAYFRGTLQKREIHSGSRPSPGTSGQDGIRSPGRRPRRPDRSVTSVRRNCGQACHRGRPAGPSRRHRQWQRCPSAAGPHGENVSPAPRFEAERDGGGRIVVADQLEFIVRRDAGVNEEIGDDGRGPPGAVSSEVDTGSREENMSKQYAERPFRFNRSGKRSVEIR
jgi:hypothetical protein